MIHRRSLTSFIPIQAEHVISHTFAKKCRPPGKNGANAFRESCTILSRLFLKFEGEGLTGRDDPSAKGPDAVTR